jgi:hypothetical protein
MKLHSKLVGIPPIYYLNLDCKLSRRRYIENQFEKYNIQNYTRISASRYDPTKYDEWRSKIIADKILTQPRFLSVLVNRIQMIVDWYNDNDSETCLMVEDDLSFDTVEYWNFDWNTIISRLPSNWDCVQFHIIGENYIPMFLSKWCTNNHGATCFMINRHYAEKLIKLHYDKGFFKFHTNYGLHESHPKYHYQSGDFVPFQIGVTYSLPLFISNSTFISDGYINGQVNHMAKASDEMVLDWWKNKSKEYLIDDIFLLNSPKRKELLFKINHNNES